MCNPEPLGYLLELEKPHAPIIPQQGLFQGDSVGGGDYQGVRSGASIIRLGFFYYPLTVWLTFCGILL